MASEPSTRLNGTCETERNVHTSRQPCNPASRVCPRRRPRWHVHITLTDTKNEDRDLMKSTQLRIAVWTLAVLPLMLVPADADEGMWLFNDLPRDQLREKYGFEPDEEWLQHVMLSSVRFNNGGSASFVSAGGLVLTNHHVAADTLHKISTGDHNYYRDGFLAETPADEVPAPDLELNQLVSIDIVTDKVEAAVKPGMSTVEALKARRAVMAEIEKQSLEETGLRSDVVTLFGGAQYHLYRHKKYTDIRLVWSPESAIAFFGGDADNFEYPRYSLDVTLFRVYEDDKPARVDHYLRVVRGGLADGQLVFVAGNPGRTQRIFTTAALRFQRDHYVPFVLDLLRRREILFQQFGLEGKEQARLAADDLHGIQNARKAYTGMIQGLQDPNFLARKQAEEDALLAGLKADHQLRKHVAAWDEIARVQARRAELLQQRIGFSGRHYDIAQTLVFLAAEDQKPNAERLPEYRESGRASLEQQLFSTAPIHQELERTKLSDSLSLLAERRRGDDPLVQQVLDGKSPQARAGRLVAGTTLADVDVRKRLAGGGQAAVNASDDPLIKLAKLLEPETRRLRKIREELQETERQAYARITEARYAVEGTDTYPDATFTLRLAFGTIKGYREDGRPIPPWTTMGGAFKHEQAHGAEPPWRLPESWRKNQARLDPQTPLNFVSTPDIIGGNSGSPAINRRGELVGVVFDGNLQSLTGRYFYRPEPDRAVSVAADALLEALGKIYGAEQIVQELGH